MIKDVFDGVERIISCEFGCGFGIHSVNSIFWLKDYIHHGGMSTLKA